MITINEVTTNRFSLNGIEYFKNFTPVVRGDYITIVNTYDARIVLSQSTIYSDFTIDGNTYANVELTQSALLDVIFTRTTLGSGGTGVWGSITGNIENQSDLLAYIAANAGSSTPEDKTGTTIVFTEDAFYNKTTPLTSGDLTFDLTDAVVGVGVIIYIDKYTPGITSDDADYIKSGSFDNTKFHEVLAVYDGVRINVAINQFEYLTAPIPTTLEGNTQIVFNDFGVSNAQEYEILFSTTNDIGTASAVPSYNGTDTDYTHSGLTNGTTYYYWFKAIGGGYLDSAYQAISGTPSNEVAWILNNFGYNSKSLDVSAYNSLPVGIWFKPDGTKLYLIDGNDLVEFDLSVAWDISTATENQVELGSTDTGSTESGLFIKDDGSQIFFISQNRRIYSAPLSSAWDISSIGSLSESSQILQTTPVGLFIKPDGTEVYVTNKTNGTVHSYTLSSAWDVTTASANNSFDASAQDTGFHGISFKDDGTKMYIHGETNDTFYEYDLGTAWDITTAVYATSLLVTSSQDADMRGFYFRPNGTYLWASGITNDTIYEYIAT